MRRHGARGADYDADDADADVARHLSSWRLRRLNAEQLQELRQMVRTADRQTHAKDVLRQRPPAQPLAGPPPAPEGDDLAARRELYAQLLENADPLS